MHYIDSSVLTIEKVREIAIEIGGTGFGLIEIDESPIFYDDNEYELQQIEYLGENFVDVDVYDSGSDSKLGDFRVKYTSLPSQKIDELVEILLNH
jgi:hypothetical protein